MIVRLLESGVIQSANARTQAVFGYDHEFLVARRITLLMRATHHVAHTAQFKRCGEPGQSHILMREVEVEGLLQSIEF